MKFKKTQELQVLMVGGRRCGKSSILASAIQFFTKNQMLNDTLNIRPITTEEGGVSLNRKYGELMAFVYGHVDDVITNNYLVDFNADTKFSTYKFKIGVKHTIGNFIMKFIDAPGESYEDDSAQFNKMISYARDSDIFIVAIDTPYLMDRNLGNCKIANCITYLEDVFSNYKILPDLNETRDNQKLKHVILVPIKCEVYRKNINAVVDKVKEVYSDLIDEMLKHKEVSVSIIPAYTAGGVEFTDFTTPEVVINKGQQLKEYYDEYGEEGMKDFRCRRLEDAIRMGSGEIEEIEENQKVIKDSMFKVRLPSYSWFKSVGEYSPKNCEQVLLHCLRFSVNKAIVNHEPSLFGMKLGTLKEALDIIANDNLLLDTGEGITHLRKLEI